MILVAVGTFIRGFDDLVSAADEAARSLGVDGLAQIGHSSIIPTHLAHTRFLGQEALQRHLHASHILVCHGGMGLIGDGLRAGCHVVVLPRRGATRRGHPANDQLAFCRRLAERRPITLCETPSMIENALQRCLARPRLGPFTSRSDTPLRIRNFLQALAS